MVSEGMIIRQSRTLQRKEDRHDTELSSDPINFANLAKMASRNLDIEIAEVDSDSESSPI